MKIKDIKISNILSFPFKSGFDTQSADISFDDKLNVIVGANGSGKSNFVEIVFTLFQTYFIEPYNYDYGYDSDRTNHLTYLTKRNDAGTNLRLNKHRKSETEESELYISFILGDSDKKNLKFIKDNLDQLNTVITKYTPGLLNISGTPINEIDIDSITEVDFKFIVKNSVKTNKVNFSLVPKTGDKVQEMVDFYLRNFDLIRKVIETGVNREKLGWENLVASFEFLSSHRLFSSFPTNVEFSPGLENSISNLTIQKKAQNIKNNTDTSYIFGLTNAKIGNQIRRDNRGSLTIEQAIDKQFTDEDSLFFRLNTLLKEYLNLSVRHKGIPSENADTLNTELYNCDTDEVTEFEQLSSGQKSIFTLIFLVITSELQNGLLMIDEPEIHLHPRLQKKYFELLKDFSIKYNLQSILITHSPVFIDENTIKNTYRFYVENGQTKIIKPEGITSSEEDLIRFLSYTNSSKIFFTNKVVIVEGDTDSYFYTYLLNNHIKANQEVEFLAIGGKGGYKKWFEFLDKFKIKHYLLTDFDFIDNAEFGDLGIQDARLKIASQGLSTEDVEKAQIVAPQTIQQAQESSTATFDSLLSKSLGEITEDDLTSLKKGAFWNRQRKIKLLSTTEELENNATSKAKIEKAITDLRSQNIYVLRWGDLEDYLAIHNKGLQSVVNYCSEGKFTSMEEKAKNDLTSIFGDLLAK